ncbi:MAG: hypothetical protein IIA85_03625 [Nanoarchaeota archaeon]|nr:hypothetical protein [Nanoarchaeota archaeon]
MVKKSIEKKFKKIISSFWFWVAVAVVSYFIFILTIPWESWFGEVRTFLAYLTQFAWIIAIVILIVDAIKWLQKTKIGDYWKISFTILGIVGIIAYVFYALSGMGIFDNFSYEYDNRIGDLDNEKIIKIHIELLEESGYEVLYFGYFGYNSSEIKDAGYIKMKSLGSRNEQVGDGLISLSGVYPNAPEYSIRILEETQDCWYNINGDDYRVVYRDSGSLEEYEFNEEGELILTEEILRNNELYQVLQNQIENPVCS